MFKKLIIIFIIFGSLLSNFYFSQATFNVTQVPETIEGAGEIGEKAWKEIEKEMPNILEKLWNERVVPVWKNMWYWFESKIKNFWQKVQELFGKEVEKRKPIIEQEFEKEKQEIKQELPKVGQSFWERFKKLIK